MTPEEKARIKIDRMFADAGWQVVRVSNTEWEETDRIHTPKEIVDMLGIDDPFAGLPVLNKKGLRACQFL